MNDSLSEQLQKIFRWVWKLIILAVNRIRSRWSSFLNFFAPAPQTSCEGCKSSDTGETKALQFSPPALWLFLVLKKPTVAVCVNTYTTPLHNADAVIWPFNGLLSPQRGSQRHSAPWTEAVRRLSAWWVLFCSPCRSRLAARWCSDVHLVNIICCCVWCGSVPPLVCARVWVRERLRNAASRSFYAKKMVEHRGLLVVSVWLGDRYLSSVWRPTAAKYKTPWIFISQDKNDYDVSFIIISSDHHWVQQKHLLCMTQKMRLNNLRLLRRGLRHAIECQQNKSRGLFKKQHFFLLKLTE